MAQLPLIHINTSGQPESIFFGSHLGIFPLREYASTSALRVDAQPAIDQAIKDAVQSGGIILFPPTEVHATQIQLIDGIYYKGAGNRSSTLTQPDGVNKSLFISGTSKTAIQFQVQCGLSDITLKKAPGADTVGSAIEMNCRVGELCHFHRLQISGFPQSGIRLNRGAQPLVLRDIHVFSCKEYGIDLKRTGGDIWHMVNLDTISGDNHGKGLIHIQGGGSSIETIRISNIKAENITEGAMPCVIEFDGMNNTRVQIENVGVYVIKPVQTVIKVTTSTIQILGGIIGASGAAMTAQTLLIDDALAGRQVAYDPNRLGFTYTSANGIV